MIGKKVFFGRRKGPQLSANQQRLLREVLPSIGLPNGQLGNLQALFGQQHQHYELEIGFGGGEHLIARAMAMPNTGFIGIEPFVNGMVKALAAVESQNLPNIRLDDREASEVLDLLPAATFDVVHLLYPDPWPKKRHHKRRFVSRENLDRIARILVLGGVFRFASDIAEYVSWTRAGCSQHPRFAAADGMGQDLTQPWPGWTRTRYEAKAVREGRTAAYLTFICQ